MSCAIELATLTFVDSMTSTIGPDEKMSDSSNENRCHKCGGETEIGFLSAAGIAFVDPFTKVRLSLVIPGEATAVNPVTAFKQGTQGAKQNEAYLLCGRRCSVCGSVELVATERMSWPPYD